MSKFHIGLFADGGWGLTTLNQLLGNAELVVDFVCLRTHPTEPGIANLAKEHGIPVFQFKKVNRISSRTVLKQFDSDLFISMSYDQIFKPKCINIPKHGIINCHAGKLPFYRGRSVLNWVLINDEKEFGITVHYIDAGIDTGDILLQEKYKIKDKDNFHTLLQIAYDACPRMVLDSIEMIRSGNVTRIPQDSIDSSGSYYRRRGPGDEWIIWTQSNRQIFNFLRALVKPGPLGRAQWQGETIGFTHADLTRSYEFQPGEQGIPGMVVKVSGQFVWVQTGNGVICLELHKKSLSVQRGDQFYSPDIHKEVSLVS